MENIPPLGIYPFNINNNVVSEPVDFTEHIQPVIINDKKTYCCPAKVHHGNGMRRSWVGGSFLIDGNHLNKTSLCAAQINNTIFGPINGKTVFVKKNINVYGRYNGFPGGSGAPIRNKF